MNKVIAIDIDDTIIYLGKTWVSWLNKMHNMAVSYDSITSWDIASFFPTLSSDEVFKPLHLKEFWKKVKPMPDAIEYIQLLIDEGFDIYLCTSTDYRNVQMKYECIIQKYFPFIPWNKVIVAHKKQLINADILIDDGVHNLLGGNYHKILFSASHNRLYDEKKNGMIRADDWREVYTQIHNIFN